MMLKMGVFCGERWYWSTSWRRNKLFRKGPRFVAVGPILIWRPSA